MANMDTVMEICSPGKKMGDLIVVKNMNIFETVMLFNDGDSRNMSVGSFVWMDILECA